MNEFDEQKWRNLYEAQRKDLIRRMDEAEYWRKKAEDLHQQYSAFERWLNDMCVYHRLPSDYTVSSMQASIMSYINDLRSANATRPCGPRQERATSDYMGRWRCDQCDTVTFYCDLLRTPHPFGMGILFGCPTCRAAWGDCTMERMCDIPDCMEHGIWGHATPTGYRHTCSKHMEETR